MNKLYLQFLNLASEEEVIEKFHNTLIDTNRGYNFFVDWNKVKKHVERYKVEINILNSLIGSKKFDDDLRKILLNYPQVLPVIPILLAIRELNFKVIRDFIDKNSDIIYYDFKVKTLTLEEIESIVEFFNKTGLKDFFVKMVAKNIQDYIMGVEVGMDSHARKNRSGNAMELLLKPIVNNLALKNGFKHVLFQRKFGYLETFYSIKVDSSIKNRKADFILVNDARKVVNIEVNFYSGTGSKPQEIVDSYIERQHELKNNGFEFIWITDGDAWRGQKNQIRKGFEKINYLLNLHFVRIGLLEEILSKI